MMLADKIKNWPMVWCVLCNFFPHDLELIGFFKYVFLNVQALKRSCHAVMLGLHATFVHKVVNSVHGVPFDSNCSFQTSPPPSPHPSPPQKSHYSRYLSQDFKKRTTAQPYLQEAISMFQNSSRFLIRKEFSVKWDLTQSEANARTGIDSKTLFISMKRP